MLFWNETKMQNIDDAKRIGSEYIKMVLDMHLQFECKSVQIEMQQNWFEKETNKMKSVYFNFKLILFL